MTEPTERGNISNKNRASFARELQEKVRQVDYSSMSMDDAIMKLFTENGLDIRIAKHPHARHEICTTVRNMLENKQIEEITNENIDQVYELAFTEGQNVFETDETKRTEFFRINEDGTLTSNISYFDLTDSIFRSDDNGSITLSIVDGILYRDEMFVKRYKRGDSRESYYTAVFDNNGVTMKRGMNERSYNSDGTEKIDRREAYCATRNSDLVTVTYQLISQDDPDYPFTQRGYFDDKNVTETFQKALYDTEGLILDLWFHPIVKGVPKTAEYGFVESGNTKQQRKLKATFNKLVRESEAFRKLATERGLIKGKIKDEGIVQE